MAKSKQNTDAGAAEPKAKPAKAKPAKESKGKAKTVVAEPAAPRVAKEPSGPVPTPRLLDQYRKAIAPGLQERFKYGNVMQVPRLSRVVLNCGLGEALQNARLMDAAVDELSRITGQKPVITRSKKAIANFRLRENQAIGCMVTLRGARMYEFLDRLINVALPRVRDFRGVSPNAFDGRGNYSLGIREQIIFPEINYDKVEKIHGMNITIVTTAKTDDEGRALLGAFGVPFRS